MQLLQGCRSATMKKGDGSKRIPVANSGLEKVKAHLNSYLSKDGKYYPSDVEVCSELLSLTSDALIRAREAEKEGERKLSTDGEGK